MARSFSCATSPLWLRFCSVWILLLSSRVVNATRRNNAATSSSHAVPLKTRKIDGKETTTVTTTNTNTAEGLKNSLASGLASFCAKALLQPFDTIKTVQQYHQHLDDNNNKALTFIQAVQLITKRKHGIVELYAGFFATALGGIPSMALYYGVYSYCKGIFVPIFTASTTTAAAAAAVPEKQQNSNGRSRKLLAVALSAAIGNTITSFSRVPYEVIKQKLQTGLYDSGNTLTCIMDLFQNHGGLRAFFPTGGVSIQMVRDIPYAIFTLVAYEFLRDHLHEYTSFFWKDMVAGATAGGFGSLMTNGLDVIKTRLQTHPELYGNGSIVICAKILYQQGGWQIFLRGSTSRLLYKIPTNGVFFVFYEFFRRALRCRIQ